MGLVAKKKTPIFLGKKKTKCIIQNTVTDAKKKSTDELLNKVAIKQPRALFLYFFRNFSIKFQFGAFRKHGVSINVGETGSSDDKVG